VTKLPPVPITSICQSLGSNIRVELLEGLLKSIFKDNLRAKSWRSAPGWPQSISGRFEFLAGLSHYGTPIHDNGRLPYIHSRSER
jgi:hypothetical protein